MADLLHVPPLDAMPQVTLPQVTITLHSSGQVETRTNLTPPGAWTMVVSLLIAALGSARQQEQQEGQAAQPRVQLVSPGGLVR